MAIFSWTNITVSLVGIYIAHRVYWEATTGARRRNLVKKHGCHAVKKRPAKFPVFGIDIIISNFGAYRARRLLDHWVSMLRDNDVHTINTPIFGSAMFMTDDPENIKALLATQFDSWSLGRERINQMASYLGHGIFTNEGKAWKESRDLLRPCFERSQVSDISIFEKHTNRLINALPKDGSTVNLNPFFHELTLDIATEFLFGRSTDALESHKTDEHMPVHEFIEAFEYCANPFTNQNTEKWGWMGAFLPDAKHKRCAKYIGEFADKIIDEEVASKSSNKSDADTNTSSTRYIFLDELLSQTSNRAVIRAELLNILLAGRDTTASLLTNTFFLLARNPDTLSRLRREITSHIGDEIPSYEQLKDMKYLRAIINESQRLYPIVPVNSRESLSDTILPRGGGPDGSSPFLVPKGSYVTYNTYAMHRRTDVYGQDANEFHPERWLEPRFRPGWNYIPFSGGPRVCIGQNFALTEAMFVIVRLLQCFEIEGRDEEGWVEWLSITCVGRGGAKVGLRLKG